MFAVKMILLARPGHCQGRNRRGVQRRKWHVSFWESAINSALIECFAKGDGIWKEDN